jgi:hypothetical protein
MQNCTKSFKIFVNIRKSYAICARSSTVYGGTVKR